MKQLLILFSFVFFSFFSYSQTEKKSDKYRLVLSPGVSYQGQVFGDINLVYMGLMGYDAPPLMWSYRVGMESNFNPKHFVYAPKIGFEVEWFVHFRGNVMSYIDNGKVDLRILPEVGIGFYYFNLCYGYNIPLLDFKTPDVSSHRISLTFNIITGEIWN